MSSSAIHFEFLLKLTPDEVMYDFLAQCGLRLQTGLMAGENLIHEKLRIAVAIECAPLSVRDLAQARMRRVLQLSDEAGMAALSAAARMCPAREAEPTWHQTATAYALWMFMHHREVFDAASRLREEDARPFEAMTLDTLRRPLPLPDDLVVGRVRLQEATLLDEASGGEFTVKAPVGEDAIDVLDMLDAWLPTDNPMRMDRFQVVAATLCVVLVPEPGQSPGHAHMLRIKRRGGSNLTDFDAQTQAKLVDWLHHWQVIPANDPAISAVSALNA